MSRYAREPASKAPNDGLFSGLDDVWALVRLRGQDIGPDPEGVANPADRTPD
jgi:hypothetical protein